MLWIANMKYTIQNLRINCKELIKEQLSFVFQTISIFRSNFYALIIIIKRFDILYIAKCGRCKTIFVSILT